MVCSKIVKRAIPFPWQIGGLRCEPCFFPAWLRPPRTQDWQLHADRAAVTGPDQLSS